MYERYIAYGDQLYLYEPMLAYHCYEFGSQSNIQNNIVLSKKTLLRQALGNTIDDRELQISYIKEIIKKYYLSGQNVFKQNPESAKQIFLFVVDMIDLLNAFIPLPNEFQQVKNFIVLSHFIPEGVSLVKDVLTPQQPIQNNSSLNQHNTNLFPVPNSQVIQQNLFPTPSQQNLFPTPSQQTQQLKQNLFPVPVEQQPVNQKKEQPKQNLFPVPSQPKQQLPQQSINLFPTPNNSTNENTIPISCQQTSSTEEIKQKTFTISTNSQPTLPISIPPPNQLQNQVHTQPKKNEKIEYKQSPLVNTIQSQNPILLRKVNIKKNIKIENIVNAWSIINKAKDSMQIGAIEKTKQKILEALQLLEE
ncbi:hypothetical protein EHI8A_109250 [Entamoeba histolytica HM-1:IMSS-B]|uniref:Uncharacterized protein n=4 Tax=Entamoeba histolytica TaxID=5759 RepID=C4LYC1_ENTH1|nr:hypothetical protein EHI_007490 [Entamoeba histolytica HM-1:IMSS]EAL49421.1 hypothetical protein EHI_007490 [Entamoeba histolytica HM-1:IMSS]EMH73797.1 hypothetical protein EHI8A_109250 [Entamoeba histolytica HM-1:IMSS-B]ENY62510.1 hypothetical protein EHI7A_101140 [Entamoeba histolytica HM-1:IMSS-A]GAT93808.1 hypothetical protein CL6EHI_007490 [Entamoeba histolytica]|eukprot:XP_654807.1 hypothetical protein EHI_007490 [Entamoeba histolytica HM-1:IMSS]